MENYHLANSTVIIVAYRKLEWMQKLVGKYMLRNKILI